jgi:hypothetical protein
MGEKATRSLMTGLMMDYPVTLTYPRAHSKRVEIGDRIIVLDDFMSEPILQLIPMFRANGWGIPCFSFANLCPTGGQ